MLWENEGGGGWLFIGSKDRSTYEKIADDPARHERYVAYRAVLTPV